MARHSKFLFITLYKSATCESELKEGVDCTQDSALQRRLQLEIRFLISQSDQRRWRTRS